jgi:hypothetical protein
VVNGILIFAPGPNTDAPLWLVEHRLILLDFFTRCFP